MLPRGPRPRSASGWADGIAGAPRGRPQRPTLLDRYGPNRPPWNVAGVDYRVGVPEGLALKDWRTMSVPPYIGVNTTTGLIYVSGDYVFDGIDFSRGCGAQIYNPNGNGANNITIKNCNFGAPPNTAIGFINDLIHDQNGAHLTIINTTIDGLNLNQMNQFITMDTSGSLLLKYCWLKNSQAQIVAFNSVSSTLIYKYNLIDDVNTHFSGAHMNWLQMYGTMAINISFNTGLQYSLGGAEGFQTDAPVGMPSPILANNTIIALPNFTDATKGAQTMSNCIHGGDSGGIITGVGTNANNYFDLSGAFFAYYGGTMTPTIGWTSANNRDMMTGKVITPG
jgi:hypothetical protein